MASLKSPIMAIVAWSVAAAASAQTEPAPDPFWNGRTMKLIIGADAGGGYDQVGRVVAQHMPRHMPGSVRILPQNMPGAGGVRATNFLANLAEKDGTAIAVLNRGVIYAGLLQSEGAQYHSEKLNWIGSPSQEVSLCVLWRPGPVETFRQAQQKEVMIGGTSPNDDTVALAATMQNVLGAKFRIIKGYKSGTEVSLAMERGEVNGRCGWSWTSLQAQQSQWYDDGKLNIIVSMGLTRNPLFPDVPLAIDMATTDEQRQVLAFILARQAMGRPFVAPAETPPARLQTLRTAFWQTMEDPEFLAEMKTLRFDVDPVSGEKLQKSIEDLKAIPRALMDQAEKALIARPSAVP